MWVDMGTKMDVGGHGYEDRCGWTWVRRRNIDGVHRECAGMCAWAGMAYRQCAVPIVNVLPEPVCPYLSAPAGVHI